MPIKQERMIVMIEAIKKCQDIFVEIKEQLQIGVENLRGTQEVLNEIEYGVKSESLVITHRALERAHKHIELLSLDIYRIISEVTSLAELPRETEIALVREETHFKAYAKRNEYARRAMERKRGGPGMTPEQKSLYYKSLREVREQEEFMERVRKELEGENETGTDGE